MKPAALARVGLVLTLTSAFVPVGARSALLPGSNPKCRVALPAGTPASPADDGLRVANLNSLHGLDDDGADYPSATTLDQRLVMQAQQLAAEKIDIVGMQEVSVFRKTANDSLREVASDLAEALAEETGERWWWCWYLANPYFTGEPDLNEGGGGPISDLSATLVSTFTGGPYAFFKDGVAVLSRYKIEEAEGLHLPPRILAEVPLCVVEALPDVADDPAAGPLCAAVAGFERRSALWVRASTPDGEVQLTTAHLAHHVTSLSDVSSFQQGMAALAFADAHAQSDQPAFAFFTCDCNAQPGDPVPLISTIEAAGWTNTFTAPCAAAGDAGCTAGADVIVTHVAANREMSERLDYVFERGEACAFNGRAIVDDAVAYTGDGWLYASDHLGVAADLPGFCY